MKQFSRSEMIFGDLFCYRYDKYIRMKIFLSEDIEK